MIKLSDHKSHEAAAAVGIPMATQSLILLAIAGIDLAVLAHMVDSHLGLTYANQDGTKMYFLWGFDFYITMPNRPWTLAHAILGTIPLLGSLHQLSKALRRENLTRHGRVGKALVICGALQIPTTCYLGIYWAQQEVINVMRGLFCVFAFLWGVWGLRVWYTAAISKNMDLHRAWGVRFAVMCHSVPIIGRFLGVIIWALFFQKSMQDEMKAKSLQATIWCILVLYFPFQEFCVWLETGSCWFYDSFSDIFEEQSVTSRLSDCKTKDDEDALLVSVVDSTKDYGAFVE